MSNDSSNATASTDQPETRQMPSGDDLAAGLLEDTAALVSDDRDTHGDAVEQHRVAAELWTTYLRAEGLLSEKQALRTDQVTRLMRLLKISRVAVGSYSVDEDRDGAGYSAISVACAVYEGLAQPEDVTRGDSE